MLINTDVMSRQRSSPGQTSAPATKRSHIGAMQSNLTCTHTHTHMQMRTQDERDAWQRQLVAEQEMSKKLQCQLEEAAAALAAESSHTHLQQQQQAAAQRLQDELEAKEMDIRELTVQLQTLQELYETQNSALSEMQAANALLSDKISTLEDEIASIPRMDEATVNLLIDDDDDDDDF